MATDNMNAWDVIKRLYESEMNAGLQTNWDGGVTAWLGDEFNGRHAEATFGPDEFDRVGEWFDFEARRLFPRSDHAGGPGIHEPPSC